MTDDLISRQAALDALRTCYETETISMDNGDEYINYEDAVGEIEQLPSTQPEIIRCEDCIYYDPPHVENDGMRLEYADLPKEAFDVLGTGLVTLDYGINVGGRCTRDYNAGYVDDKRVYVPHDNFCGRAERREKAE